MIKEMILFVEFKIKKVAVVMLVKKVCWRIQTFKCMLPKYIGAIDDLLQVLNKGSCLSTQKPCVRT